MASKIRIYIHIYNFCDTWWHLGCQEEFRLREREGGRCRPGSLALGIGQLLMIRLPWVGGGQCGEQRRPDHKQSTRTTTTKTKTKTTAAAADIHEAGGQPEPFTDTATDILLVHGRSPTPRSPNHQVCLLVARASQPIEAPCNTSWPVA